MNLKSKLFLILSVLMLLVVFLQPALSVNASSSNILQPADINNTFTPTTVAKQNYYIVNSGTDYSNVNYKNNLPGSFVSSYLNTNSYGSNSPTNYKNKNSLNTADTVNSPLISPNPFIQANASYNVPNVVQIDNNNSKLTIPETKPFSLHIDQSMTFFGEADKPYVAVLQESSNLLLDVSVKNSNNGVDFYLFNFNTTQYNYLDTFYTQNTVPVFNTNNKNDTYIFEFVPYYTNAIITVTPHKLNQNTFASSNVKVNTTATYTVNQGACLDNSKTNSNNFDLMSLNSFKFDVTNGTYYQIFVDNSQTDNYNSNCNTNNQYGSVSPTLLNSTMDFNHLFGYLDENGYTFQATSNGSITLAVQNSGYLRRDVTVFFRSISAFSNPVKEVPMQINKDIQLATHEYNTFTISSPSVLAINQTNSVGSPYFPALSYYSYNTTTQKWDLLTTVSNTGTALSPIEGNLTTFNSHTLQNTHWVYIPSGKYAVRTDYNSNDVYNYHYTFNVLKINQMGASDSQTYDVNNNTLFAVQYNRNAFNFNMLNLTTTAHDNISVDYEAVMLNKYSDYSPYFFNQYTTGDFGNFKTSSGWVAQSANNTILYENLKLTDPDVPIFIIHPFSAYNRSYIPVNSFNTQLTLNSTSLTNDTLGNAMLHPSVLTSSETVPINEDFTSSTTQYHYFKLDVQSDTLYNVTVMTIGNNSNSLNSWNLSFSSLAVFNGKYTDVSLPFGTTSDYSQITSTTDSSLFVTQSTNAYLRVIVQRNYDLNTFAYDNGTLSITLTKITSNALSFPNKIDPTTLTWNKTVSQFEVSNKNTLFTVIKPSHATPGFEFLPLFIALIIIPIYKKHKKVN